MQEAVRKADVTGRAVLHGQQKVVGELEPVVQATAAAQDASNRG